MRKITKNQNIDLRTNLEVLSKISNQNQQIIEPVTFACDPKV